MVELIAPSTNFQSNKDRLKHIFATYGMLQRLESDNGQLLQLTNSMNLQMQEEFQHHQVTSLQ